MTYAFRLLLVVLAEAWSLGAVAQTSATPIDESADAVRKLGYHTVSAALEALKTKQGASVSVTKPDGWTIVVEPETRAVWSFTPEGHYAYPAVVRRTVVRDPDGQVSVEMVALCQAEKEPCDRLIREFQKMSDGVAQSMRGRSTASGAK